MGDSYRIRTELGTNKSIILQLDQDFEFLEILSLKIQQSEIYTRSCADYGVLVVESPQTTDLDYQTREFQFSFLLNR